MKELSGKVTSKGQLVLPAELRRKHKIEAGTKVKFFDDEFGRIIIAPITEEYIERMMGCLAGGPDYLAIWEREHRLEKDFSDKPEQRSRRSHGRESVGKGVLAQSSNSRTRTPKRRATLSA